MSGFHSRFSFPVLKDLHKDNERIKVIRESKEAVSTLQNLMVHAREIDEWLGSDFKTLEEFNEQSDKKEPY